MTDDASCEKIRRIEGLNTNRNPSQDEKIEPLPNSIKLPIARREDNKEQIKNAAREFKMTKIRCYPISKYGSVYFCVFNPASPILACGLNDGIIMTFEGSCYQTPFASWVSNTEQFKVENLSAITDMTWNCDGTQLYASFGDGTLVAWQLNGQEIFKGKNSDDQIWAIICNPYCPYILATRNSDSIIVWNFQANIAVNVLQRFHGFQASIIRDVKWIADNQLVSCSDDETIQIYHTEKASGPIKAFHLQSGVSILAWNADFKFLASCCLNGFMKIWSIEKEEPLYSWESGAASKPKCISWLPLQKSIYQQTKIACGLDDGTVIVCTLMSEGRISTTTLKGHSTSIWDVNFSLDGRLLASIDLKGGFTIWSAENLTSIFQCNLIFRALRPCPMWNLDGTKLAVANPTEEVCVLEIL